MVTPPAVNTNVSAGSVEALPTDWVVLESQRYRPVYFWSKRVLDLVLSTTLLLILAPLLLLIAVLIKLDSKGPAIFVQRRVGAKPQLKGEEIRWILYSFPCLKFRSMVSDADPAWHQASVREFCSGASGKKKQWKARDSRVTRVGRILRKTSLDELPQLINVFRGEMSLVGPRPVPLYEAALYQKSQTKRLAATPGITGIWQVKGRYQVPFDEMIRMDIHYAANASFWLDLQILCQTVPAVLFARGAN